MRRAWLQSSGETRNIIFAGPHMASMKAGTDPKSPARCLVDRTVPGNRDGIRWIKDLATEFPRIRILVVTRQSEQIYAERALHAGAAGYWMKNGSAQELIRALDTVAAGEVYISPVIAALAIRRFAHREKLPCSLRRLTDRELVILGLIAAEQGVGRIAEELGISRSTVETHCEHIKLKLGYHNAEALKRGAHKLLGKA